mmetsp:Transcript_14367/g.15931  ORF Transcript_14367/g.15931 Transcript_14367/m.15931 type:complete len:128 (-) Transcript_14367:96-479(-)
MTDDHTVDLDGFNGGSDVIYEGSPECYTSCSDWCRCTHWRITRTYIEYEQGCCCQKLNTLQLLRVKDISYKEACCCCGACGEIVIYSSDTTDAELHIRGIPNGKKVYKALRTILSQIHANAKLELDV